jgi:hypothetical protein
MSLPAVPTGLTVEEFKAALPDKMHKSVNQVLINSINVTLAEPELYEQYRENLISYTHVMKEGKFKIANYVSAVKYVSHKLMGMTNIDAYSKTFPEKIVRFTTQGVASKDIASYVSAYNKSKLVNLILEQTLVPMWVLNQDMYQKALNTQAELMLTANSEKVRSDAANSILTHLKQPETQKIELDVGMKQDSSIDQLRRATQDLVAETRQAIKAGVLTAQQAAHAPVVIEGEAEVVES